STVSVPETVIVKPGMVDYQRIDDHRVAGAAVTVCLVLTHAVADHLAAAELDLFAIGGEVALHLDHELRIGQPYPVAGGRAIHVGIKGAGHLHLGDSLRRGRQSSAARKARVIRSATK